MPSIYLIHCPWKSVRTRGSNGRRTGLVAAIGSWLILSAMLSSGPFNANAQDYAYWRENHWAWKPIEPEMPPSIEGDEWSANAIDQFVLSGLRKVQLSPSPQAAKDQLYRRLHFDLLGLPPSHEQTLAFVNDQRPDAYRRVVDQLLASAAYGERWGRHWLDLARYADNGGFNSQTKELYTNFPYAYTYRDYVIRAFNEDLPYDRFVVEQIAADQLSLGEDNRALAALGFLSLGDKSFGVSREDRIDDCIDTVTRGFMAITVSCARCHDHKYDPVPIDDYYSLFGVFQNSNIDVASRLHTREKSEGLPLLFRSQAERADYETRHLAATQALDRTQQRYHDEAIRHCRERIGDYLLAASERASDEQQSGLSEVLVKRWRERLQKQRSDSDPVFSIWHAFTQLDKNSSTADLQATCDELTCQETDQATVGFHPRILAAVREAPLESIADVADAYRRVLDHVIAKRDVSTASSLAADDQELADALIGEKSPFGMKRDDMLKLPIHSGADELQRLRKELHNVRFRQPRAVAVRDKEKMEESYVYLRGNRRNRGSSVPRQPLALIAPDRTPFQQGSGRLELARSIVDPSNPLTSRVIVNRVWQFHFGRGLVTGPSDFGTRSDPPSHPRLLDYLAWRLMEEDWSLKSLHRRIVLSRTYRQSSQDRSEGRNVDPENRLLWRMNRQRLSFESLRDSLLVASGELDTSMGGEPTETWKSVRRTVYGYVNRYRIAAAYQTFDFPSTNRTAGERLRTLVPQQSLFLMNAPFVEERARHLVTRPEFTQSKSDSQRLALLFRWILARVPHDAEAKAAHDFLQTLFSDSATDRDEGGSCTESTESSEVTSDGWIRLAQGLFLSNEFSYVD